MAMLRAGAAWCGWLLLLLSDAAGEASSRCLGLNHARLPRIVKDAASVDDGARLHRHTAKGGASGG
jgi:hypothetical protein